MIKIGTTVFLAKQHGDLKKGSIGLIKKYSENHLIINWYIISTDSHQVFEEYIKDPLGYIREYHTNWWVDKFLREHVEIIKTEKDFLKYSEGRSI